MSKQWESGNENLDDVRDCLIRRQLEIVEMQRKTKSMKKYLQLQDEWCHIEGCVQLVARLIDDQLKGES